MRKIKLPASTTRALNRAALKIRKHSPEILVASGIVGVVTSTVMACKATTKIDEVLTESKEHVEMTKKYVEDNGFTEKYTENDYKKDLTIMYTQRGMKLVKLYAPAVILGTVSITAILAGHNILRKRNVALAAAYATVDKGFKEYRGRVIERFGEELDRELKYNIKSKDVEEVKVNEETGKEEISKKTVNVADPNAYSDYARFFDDGCTGWTKDPEYNLMFLKDQQRYANDRLQSKGSLFLNEVYDMLGIPRTKAGACVGWIYDEKNPVGDNFVDFGIYDMYNERKRDFVNGYERTILLDFNVDGNILDLI
jgi:hypothetical protein